MNAVVRTVAGAVEGVLDIDGVRSFRGVPYARPPVGPLRWQPPQEPQAWQGVRPATAYAPACVQPPGPPTSLVYGNEAVMSEDCLYLNVYTASSDRDERRPVIVWLHHGGFIAGWSGAPMYDGRALARAGVVLVTINYRLGRLGFLAHPALTSESAHGSSGNYGLLDQIAALRWVRDNIAAFGGDPGCVTLYGVSAGSASVSLHMTSPLSAGLFHRAIGGSGGLFGPVGSSSEAGEGLQVLDAAERLGAEVMEGVGARSAEELRALSVDAILQARATDFHFAPRGVMDTTYPILDGHVVPADPFSTFADGRQNDVPLITGSNRHERVLTPHNADTDAYVADARAFFGPSFDRFIALFPPGPDGVTEASSRDATSDRIFAWQNWIWARMHAESGQSPVYYYDFAHEPPVPAGRYAEQASVGHVGAFHSAEIPYAFRTLDARDWPWADADRALMETLSGYWIAFASTGDPNGAGRPDWPAFTPDDRQAMELSVTPGAREVRESERFAFWDEFYASLRQAPTDRYSRSST